MPFYSIGVSESAVIASIKPHSYNTYHTKGVAYDVYSVKELGQLQPRPEWLTFPLPNEVNCVKCPSPWYPIDDFNTSETKGSPPRTFSIQVSPMTTSTLAYIETIYVVTDKRFVARHDHLLKTFEYHQIPTESIVWQTNWTRETCKGQRYEEVKMKLNPNSSKLITSILRLFLVQYSFRSVDPGKYMSYSDEPY